MLRTEDLTVNFGPQHPSTHGVLRIIATLDGERIVDAQPDIGYLHRNFEKIVEKWTYPQIAPFSGRNDYVAAMTNELAYVMAVEKLMGIQVPERAQYIRVIMSELQRIASHLIFYGTYGMDLGAFTPFLYAMREREDILKLYEMATGGRLTYSYMRIGGVARDIDEAFISGAYKFLQVFEKALVEYRQLLTGNAIFESRTQNVGILSAEDAISYGATGPVLRGSGVKWDLRKNEPYLVYDRFEFEVPTGTVGDCYDRYFVRMEEMAQSAKIIKQALDNLPAGEVIAKVPKVIKPPAGEVYSRIEAPRGELGVYIVSDGSDKPYRLKWRAPSFSNLAVLPKLAKGAIVADMIAITGSIDIVLGEVDR